MCNQTERSPTPFLSTMDNIVCVCTIVLGVYTPTRIACMNPLSHSFAYCAAIFAQTSWLGLEDMFDCWLHPVIYVDGIQYFIIAKCFSSSVIWGHATTVWFVSKLVPPGDQKDIFIIKDSWVNVRCLLSEEEILQGLKDINCIPKLEKAWTVQQDGQNNSTSLHHPEKFMTLFGIRKNQ